MAADRHRPHGRPGFGLLAFLLVVIVGLGLSASVLALHAATSAESERIRRTETFLTDITTEKRALPLFIADTKKIPKTLSQLSKPLTTADSHICNSNYTNAQVNSWSGRYADRVYPDSGTPIGIGVARDTMEYEVSGGAWTILVVDGVEEAVATRLDLRIDDGVAGTPSSTGTVRWTTPVAADGTVTVRLYMSLGTC